MKTCRSATSEQPMCCLKHTECQTCFPAGQALTPVERTTICWPFNVISCTDAQNMPSDTKVQQSLQHSLSRKQDKRPSAQAPSTQQEQRNQIHRPLLGLLHQSSRQTKEEFQRQIQLRQPAKQDGRAVCPATRQNESAGGLPQTACSPVPQASSVAGSAKHQHVSGLPEQPTAESSEGAQQAPIRQRPESKCPICGLQLHESQIQQHMQEELALMDETWPQDAGIDPKGSSGRQPPQNRARQLRPGQQHRRAQALKHRLPKPGSHQAPVTSQVLVFGQDPMKVAQPAAHAKKRRKGCGVFNHYADGSGEWDADTIGIEGASMQTWEGVGFAGFGGSFGPS